MRAQRRACEDDSIWENPSLASSIVCAVMDPIFHSSHSLIGKSRSQLKSSGLPYTVAGKSEKKLFPFLKDGKKKKRNNTLAVPATTAQNKLEECKFPNIASFTVQLIAPGQYRTYRRETLIMLTPIPSRWKVIPQKNTRLKRPSSRANPVIRMCFQVNKPIKGKQFKPRKLTFTS